VALGGEPGALVLCGSGIEYNENLHIFLGRLVRKEALTMELKNVLTPWNWFKKEEEQTRPARSLALTPSGSNPFDRLHQDMDRLFEDFFRGFPLSPFSRGGRTGLGSLLHPQVDIAEGPKAYTITVEVPGVEEKDVALTLSEGTLTIHGEKRYEQESQDKQYHRVERSYGSFQRVISLPTDTDENEVKATFKNGVLTVTVGKMAQATSHVKKIAINS